MERCLSIFVDESGDFGFAHGASDYYLFTMVFHDQDKCLMSAVSHLEDQLNHLGYPKHCIHSGPLIRRELDYIHADIETRRHLLYCMRKFARHAPVNAHTFLLNKKHLLTSYRLQARLSRELGIFIQTQRAFFSDYDRIILYYDNGQAELGRVLNASLNTLLDVEVRVVEPVNYRLFQLADYICTLELIHHKKLLNECSESEKKFFYKPKEFEKQFMSEIRKLQLPPR